MIAVAPTSPLEMGMRRDSTNTGNNSADPAGLVIETICDLPGGADGQDLAAELASAASTVSAALADAIVLPAGRTAVVALSSDAAVQELNRTWRGLDKPTNVLSFPSVQPPLPPDGATIFLGDVMLAAETIAREASELGIPPGHHLRHLVLHGLLHLLGYDHESEDEAQQMEALETRVLAAIGIADPYISAQS